MDDYCCCYARTDDILVPRDLINFQISLVCTNNLNEKLKKGNNIEAKYEFF